MAAFLVVWTSQALKAAAAPATVLHCCVSCLTAEDGLAVDEAALVLLGWHIMLSGMLHAHGRCVCKQRVCHSVQIECDMQVCFLLFCKGIYVDLTPVGCRNGG